MSEAAEAVSESQDTLRSGLRLGQDAVKDLALFQRLIEDKFRLLFLHQGLLGAFRVLRVSEDVSPVESVLVLRGWPSELESVGGRQWQISLSDCATNKSTVDVSGHQ